MTHVKTFPSSKQQQNPLSVVPWGSSSSETAYPQYQGKWKEGQQGKSGSRVESRRPHGVRYFERAVVYDASRLFFRSQQTQNAAIAITMGLLRGLQRIGGGGKRNCPVAAG